MDEPELSVVVPAYDEEARITATLDRVLAYLGQHFPGHESELIVVDDGSRDATAGLVEGQASADPRLRLIRLPANRGKGAAVRAGVAASRGRWVLFSDADLSTPIEEVERLLRVGRGGADVVIGSRAMAESDIRVRQPAFREAMGRTFNVLVQGLLLGGFQDTQCGFKLFRGEVGRSLFAEQRLDGFAFDVEVLLLAKERGHAVREVPVVWTHAPNSKVSPVTDASRMFRDLVALRVLGPGRRR